MIVLHNFATGLKDTYPSRRDVPNDPAITRQYVPQAEDSIGLHDDLVEQGVEPRQAFAMVCEEEHFLEENVFSQNPSLAFVPVAVRYDEKERIVTFALVTEYELNAETKEGRARKGIPFLALPVHTDEACLFVEVGIPCPYCEADESS